LNVRARNSEFCPGLIHRNTCLGDPHSFFKGAVFLALLGPPRWLHRYSTGYMRHITFYSFITVTCAALPTPTLSLEDSHRSAGRRVAMEICSHCHRVAAGQRAPPSKHSELYRYRQHAFDHQAFLRPPGLAPQPCYDFLSDPWFSSARATRRRSSPARSLRAFGDRVSLWSPTAATCHRSNSRPRWQRHSLNG